MVAARIAQGSCSLEGSTRYRSRVRPRFGLPVGTLISAMGRLRPLRLAGAPRASRGLVASANRLANFDDANLRRSPRLPSLVSRQLC